VKWFFLIFLNVVFLGDILSTLYPDSFIETGRELNPFITSSKVFVAGKLFSAACLSVLLLLAYPSPATASRIRKMSYAEILKPLNQSMPIKKIFHKEGGKYPLIYITISLIFAISILGFIVVVSNVFVHFIDFGLPNLIRAFLGIFSIELSGNSLFFLLSLVKFPICLAASFFLLKKWI